MPLGEFNKMYDYTIQEVVDSHKIKLKSKLKSFRQLKTHTKKKKEETMSNIIVYSKNNCVYCDKAKVLKALKFEEKENGIF